MNKMNFTRYTFTLVLLITSNIFGAASGNKTTLEKRYRHWRRPLLSLQELIVKQYAKQLLQSDKAITSIEDLQEAVEALSLPELVPVRIAYTQYAPLPQAIFKRAARRLAKKHCKRELLKNYKKIPSPPTWLEEYMSIGDCFALWFKHFPEKASEGWY